MKSLSHFFLALFAGVIIFIGLPLLGWGLGHIPEFFENPARTSYVVVIFALQIFSLIYNPQVGRNQGNRKSDVPRSKLDLILIQIFSLGIVILAPSSDSSSFGVLFKCRKSCALYRVDDRYPRLHPHAGGGKVSRQTIQH